MLQNVEISRKLLSQIMNKQVISFPTYTLYQDSCFKVLKKLDSKSIDFIFADPPYFLSDGGITCVGGKISSVNKGKWDQTISLKEKLSFSKRWLKECYRILKDQGTIMISGTYHIIYIIGFVLEAIGFEIINNITWIKKNPPPNLACKCFKHSSETILWAKKKNSKKYTFNYQLMKKLNQDKQMSDIWVFSRPGKKEKLYGKHPTQKPLNLLERIILATTNENDLVLDPFMGSGTTGVASLIHHRKFKGIEIDKTYFEIAKKRLLDVKE